MPDGWASLGYLAGIVGFWLVVFFVAVRLTRWSLRGVGELSAAELSDLDASSADEVASNGAKGTNASSAKPAGSH